MKSHQIWWQSPQNKKVINRQTKFTWKTPPPSANRVKATSPEGETKTFTSVGEAAKELGFSERGVGKAFHEKKIELVNMSQNGENPNPMLTLKLL